MILHELLLQILAFLGFSVILVSLFQKLGLGSILGYLAAGLLIGPAGLGMVSDPSTTSHIAEFGVVFLLFIIGLELQPLKLWSMRHHLLGFGGLQLLFCTVAFSLLAKTLGMEWVSSWVLGFSMALSSTAFALQSLSDKKVLNTEFGRASFAILLTQDIFAIPALAVIPTLGIAVVASGSSHAVDVHWGWAIGVIAALAVASRTIMGPFLRAVAATRSRDLFTGVTLLVVIGVSFLMETLGLSMALGAFLAGVFLSESEYRHELEADLNPFKGLLMGLFFISVGISVDLGLLLREPVLIIGITLVYLVTKGALLFAVGRIMGLSSTASHHMAAYLMQGGEFAFVIFGVGQSAQVLTPEWRQVFTLVVTLSMILSPLIILGHSRFVEWVSRCKPEINQFDSFEDANNAVIIAGFGRFGQIFGRILRAQGIAFTAIDHDSEQIELLRRFGNKVYYGDASRKEILEAAGAHQAKYFILAVDDMETSVRIAQILAEDFPHLKIFARARNRQHTFDLLELGAHHIRRETIDSSLHLAEKLLIELGHPAVRAEQIIERFQKHDEIMLVEQFKVRHDQKDFIDVSRQGMEQLAQVLKEDAEKTYLTAPTPSEENSAIS